LGNNIETLDLLLLIDDTIMDLANGRYAIKPVAMLLSSFEQVMVVDADPVFLQPPEILFENEGYRATGTYFFQDRLMYRNAFPERRERWNSHLKYNPLSATFSNSASY